ncbi:MAG TPA: hypothetical protein VG939_01055 [Caulobacteraceae bacterium]|nr:hypothetical protein [Caulobacteraceae bacterium]
MRTPPFSDIDRPIDPPPRRTVRLQAKWLERRSYRCAWREPGPDDGADELAAYDGARPPTVKLDAAAEAAAQAYRRTADLADCLITLRRQFDNDLDRALIALVLGLSDLDGRRRRRPARGLNILSLADISGIPRETVRRKLAQMQAAGRVRRAADGLFHLGEGDPPLRI